MVSCRIKCKIYPLRVDVAILFQDGDVVFGAHLTCVWTIIVIIVIRVELTLQRVVYFRFGSVLAVRLEFVATTKNIKPSKHRQQNTKPIKYIYIYINNFKTMSMMSKAN